MRGRQININLIRKKSKYFNSKSFKSGIPVQPFYKSAFTPSPGALPAIRHDNFNQVPVT
jgi:hypothetical protein